MTGPMTITHAAEYAIRSVLHLAAQPEGKMVHLDEIAEAQELPKQFVKKLLSSLVKDEILIARKGVKGGFAFDRPPEEITVKRIVEAVDGPIHLSHCLHRKGECKHDGNCPIQRVWREAQGRMLAVLDGYTVEDMIKDA